MVFAAEFGSGQVLWSILWFSLFVMWIVLVFSVFGAIMRAPDMSGWGKAMWALGIIFLPFLGVFMYLIVHGDDMGGRDAPAPYPAPTRLADETSAELTKLAGLHESGVLNDDEYERAKARAVTG